MSGRGRCPGGLRSCQVALVSCNFQRNVFFFPVRQYWWRCVYNICVNDQLSFHVDWNTKDLMYTRLRKLWNLSACLSHQFKAFYNYVTRWQSQCFRPGCVEWNALTTYMYLPPYICHILYPDSLHALCSDWLILVVRCFYKKRNFKNNLSWYRRLW